MKVGQRKEKTGRTGRTLGWLFVARWSRRDLSGLKWWLTEGGGQPKSGGGEREKRQDETRRDE